MSVPSRRLGWGKVFPVDRARRAKPAGLEPLQPWRPMAPRPHHRRPRVSGVAQASRRLTRRTRAVWPAPVRFEAPSRAKLVLPHPLLGGRGGTHCYTMA